MPFFEIRPTSVTSPTCEYTLRVVVQRSVKKCRFGFGILRKVISNAPNMASGTEPARITKGSRKLLNCAASTRKMSTTASRKAGRNLSPSVRSWRDSPV